VITLGQAHDNTAFPALMQEIDCNPEHMRLAWKHLGISGVDEDSCRCVQLNRLSGSW
jgi:hypothetical protein